MLGEVVLPQLNAALPIVFDDGTMQPAFRDQQNVLNRAVPLVGSGSPETVVLAPQYSLYINSAGASGTLLYVKKLADIGGDKTKGWVAV